MILYFAIKDDKKPKGARVRATVLDIDRINGAVWVLSEKPLAAAVSEGVCCLWNTADQRPVLLGECQPHCSFEHLHRVPVELETVDAQRPKLQTHGGKPAPWPGHQLTLRDFLVERTTERGLSARAALAVARWGVHRTSDFQSNLALEDWLSSETPPPHLDLSVPREFSRAMRVRPHLFLELEQVVADRRLVFLLGGENAYLHEFLDGFREHVDGPGSSCQGHVSVAFDADTFHSIRSAWLPTEFLYLLDLDCLFASIAYCAVDALRQRVGGNVKDVFTASMIGQPVRFAAEYLKPAGQHSNHLDCVKRLLAFIRDALEKAGHEGSLTIFLPFDRLELEINGNTAARRHLWEGVEALRQVLEERPEECPSLGLVIAARSVPLPPDTNDWFVRHAILRIPPLTRSEVARLVERWLGGVEADQATLDELDAQAGGVPWFLHLLFRCLPLGSTANQAGGQPGLDRVRVQNAATQARSLVEQAALANVQASNDVIRGDVQTYLDEVVELLRDTRAALATRKLFQAWEHPDRSTAAPQRAARGVDVLTSTWLATGLVWTRGVDEDRGESLSSLRDFPQYQFAAAGALPLTFAKTARSLANRLDGGQE